MDRLIWLSLIKDLRLHEKKALLATYKNSEVLYNELHSALDTDDEALRLTYKIRSDCEKKGIFTVLPSELGIPDFPDIPLVLYCRGVFKGPTDCIGIVGTRRCSGYGREIASDLAQKAASVGFTIVSGMAKGIDAYAHTAALNSNGYTIAVLGNGPDICYPSEHRGLMDSIVKSGLIISEYPPGTRATAYSFPLRNRIIAAISKHLIIVESDLKGGAMITADNALKYQKPLYAVPGNIDASESSGCNSLIRLGKAKILTYDTFYSGILHSHKGTEPAFVQSSLFSDYNPVQSASDSLSESQKEILKILSDRSSYHSITSISEKANIPITKLYEELTELELIGTIKTEGEKIWLSQ